MVQWTVLRISNHHPVVFFLNITQQIIPHVADIPTHDLTGRALNNEKLMQRVSFKYLIQFLLQYLFQYIFQDLFQNFIPIFFPISIQIFIILKLICMSPRVLLISNDGQSIPRCSGQWNRETACWRHVNTSLQKWARRIGVNMLLHNYLYYLEKD